MRAPRSLQWRLLAWVLTALALVWLVAARAIWVDAQHEIDELLDSHLAQAASLLVSQQVHEYEELDKRFESPPLHPYVPRVAFQVWRAGKLVTRSPNATVEAMSTAERGFETRQIAGQGWRVFAARDVKSGIQVYVGEETDSRSAILRAVIRSLLMPLLVALPVLGLAAWWGVRRGLQPLRTLGMAVAQREPHVIEPIALVDAPTEMQPLVDGLNRLFERIAELLAAERRFNADAAHELRTPIAAIRAQTQVAVKAGPSPALDHALQAALQGCDRAAHLVDQLLMLAHVEASPHGFSKLVDLSEITRTVVGELAPMALARQQGLELRASTRCQIRGEASLLAVLVRNLVDNAIRYTPRAASIRVAVTVEDGHTVLSADDGGPGLSPLQMQRLGERFYRVLGTGQSGSGLGWSIVRRIAAAHDAKTVVESSPLLGGLSVRIRFPT